MDVSQVKDELLARAGRLTDDIEAFKNDMLQRLEEAQNDAILAALAKMNARLDAIERRLPPEEEVE